MSSAPKPTCCALSPALRLSATTDKLARRLEGQAMTRTGVYPGTFDPITLGHMDIIRRGVKLVDSLVIGVTTNPSKSPMFSVEERMEMVRREVAGCSDGQIRIVSFDSLLMDFAEREGASVIIRGLRAVADFEYEYQMAGMNQQLNDRIETVFLMADVSLQPIASRLVKEIALYGGEIRKFVSPAVADEVRRRVEEIGRKGS
jgi:pantetheine-phosphate adenylyltransferase